MNGCNSTYNCLLAEALISRLNISYQVDKGSLSQSILSGQRTNKCNITFKLSLSRSTLLLLMLRAELSRMGASARPLNIYNFLNVEQPGQLTSRRIVRHLLCNLLF